MKTSIYLPLVLLVIMAAACNRQQKTSDSVQSQTETISALPVEMTFIVQGMTCEDCENSIKKGINKLEGISMVEANFKDSTTRVVFNPEKTDASQIVAAIEGRGYKVVPDQK